MAAVWTVLARLQTLVFAREEELVGAGDVVVVQTRGERAADCSGGKDVGPAATGHTLVATDFLADFGADVAQIDDDDSVEITVGDEEEDEDVNLVVMRVNGKRTSQILTLSDGKPRFDAAWPGGKGPSFTPGPEATEIAVDLGQATRLHSAALRQLGLRPGRNELSYAWKRANGESRSLDDASIFLLQAASRIVVVNLDVFVDVESGGQLAPADGVHQEAPCVRALARIARNAYDMLFVSSRFSVERASTLRCLLFREIGLPEGALLLCASRAPHAAAELRPRPECQAFAAETLRGLRANFDRNPFVALFAGDGSCLDHEAVAAPRSRTFAPDAESPSGWASRVGQAPLQTDVIDLAFPKITTKACFGYHQAAADKSIYFYA